VPPGAIEAMATERERTTMQRLRAAGAESARRLRRGGRRVPQAAAVSAEQAPRAGDCHCGDRRADGRAYGADQLQSGRTVVHAAHVTSDTIAGPTRHALRLMDGPTADGPRPPWRSFFVSYDKTTRLR
jgi:type IV secretory pathway TrbL component